MLTAFHRWRRPIARIGPGHAQARPDLISDLGVEGGAVVAIQRRRTAYAVAWQASPKEAKDVIRIDGNLRSNLGVGIDDRVTVRKSEARPAKRIVLAPTSRTRLVGGPQYLLRTLLGRPIGKGEELGSR